MLIKPNNMKNYHKKTHKLTQTKTLNLFKSTIKWQSQQSHKIKKNLSIKHHKNFGIFLFPSLKDCKNNHSNSLLNRVKKICYKTTTWRRNIEFFGYFHYGKNKLKSTKQKIKKEENTKHTNRSRDNNYQKSFMLLKPIEK